MAEAKVPTKKETSKADKALSTSKSSPSRSKAAKPLAKESASVRKVYAAPKEGTVPRAKAKSAVAKTAASKKVVARKSAAKKPA